MKFQLTLRAGASHFQLQHANAKVENSVFGPVKMMRDINGLTKMPNYV